MIKQAGQKLQELSVKKGQTYTFKVTNTAGYAHNFYIGPADKLAANDTAGLPGLPQFDSGTQEFQYTPDADGQLEFACTVPGHYPTMHGALTVQP